MNNVIIEDKIISVDTNCLRQNLTRLLTQKKGETVYIMKYGKLVAELRMYTKEQQKHAELDLARILVENSKEYSDGIPEED
ncbi:MAG: hypothetical protein FJW68_08475 [Actinobacteria bacterium]|nr:hypothetical protein [Actinomycetota bacterium]